MAKLSGEITCKHCKRIYKWDCHIPNKASSRDIYVEIVDPEFVHASRVNSVKSDVYELLVRCKFCDEAYQFIYTSDNTD